MANYWQEAINKGASQGVDSMNQGIDAAFDQRDKLRQLIKGSQLDTAREAAKITAQGVADEAGFQSRRGAAKSDFEEMGDLHKGQKVSINAGKENYGIAQAEAPARDTSKDDARFDRFRKDLSGRREKMSGFDTSLRDLEAVTNRDGAGGILTNPKAQMMSGGKVASAVPSGAMGIAEFLHIIPKGTSEEDKSMQRLVLEYKKATSGLRVTDEQMKMERAALGNIVSGDPELKAKAVRALGRIVQHHYNVQNAGYRPEIVDAVNGVMGDPSDLYGRLYDDGASGVVKAPPPAGNSLTRGNNANAGSDQPAGLDPVKEARRQTLLKKAAGK